MDDEHKIRERAYHLWLDEGQPEDRSDHHWHRARELQAIEDSQMSATRKPDEGSIGPTGEPVEEPLAVANEGEFPTLTDEGEEIAPPSHAHERVEGPL